MLRLSSKGWNNVIIFAMLAMILLLNNITGKLTDTGAEQARLLLPEDAVIMSLQFDQYKVERIGQSWRTNAPLDQPGTSLSTLTQAWQSVMLKPTDIHPQGLPVVAVVWLAGENQGRVVQLFPSDNTPLVKYGGSYFVLLKPQIHKLLLTGEA